MCSPPRFAHFTLRNLNGPRRKRNIFYRRFCNRKEEPCVTLSDPDLEDSLVMESACVLSSAQPCSVRDQSDTEGTAHSSSAAICSSRRHGRSEGVLSCPSRARARGVLYAREGRDLLSSRGSRVNSQKVLIEALETSWSVYARRRPSSAREKPLSRRPSLPIPARRCRRYGLLGR